MTGPPFMSYQPCWKCVSSPLQRADTLDILSYRHRMSTGKYKTFSSSHTTPHHTPHNNMHLYIFLIISWYSMVNTGRIMQLSLQISSPTRSLAGRYLPGRKQTENNSVPENYRVLTFSTSEQISFEL